MTHYSRGNAASARCSRSLLPRAASISSRYFTDREKYEYPAAWRNPFQQWMENREQYQNWKLDVQNQYLNKQRQLYHSLNRQPYYLRREAVMVTSDVALPNVDQWESVDSIEHLRYYGTRPGQRRPYSCVV